MSPSLIFAALAAVLVACAPPPRAVAADGFPSPDRPVASIVASHSNPEPERDAVGEATKVMELIGAGPGKVVADIGAGDGYFTVRLAPRLAPGGKVVAVDVIPNYLDGLKRRVAAAKLANVEFVLGGVDDPRLQPRSVDVALLVRMYHEIEEPYAYAWRLWDSLKPGGVIAIAERDRLTQYHGTPPALLRCELEAVGYRQIAFHDLGPETGYLALFAPGAARVQPGSIKVCRQ